MAFYIYGMVKISPPEDWLKALIKQRLIDQFLHNFKILMDSVKDYARQWEKREKEDIYTLSEWVKSVKSLIQIRFFLM